MPDLYPVIDRLQWHLERGAYIRQQDGECNLFAADGEGIACGKTLKEMLVNLVMSDIGIEVDK